MTDTPKFCRDCIYFRWNGHGTPICETVKRDHHHLGIALIRAAEDAREDPDECGPEAKWFERRPPVVSWRQRFFGWLLARYTRTP